MSAIQPIRPDEVGPAQAKYLPPQVIEVFNRLIASRFDGKKATVKQDHAVAAIIAALGVERKVVFAEHYLDIEEAYRAAGWKVIYDKPAYNEDYPATFEFSKP